MQGGGNLNLKIFKLKPFLKMKAVTITPEDIGAYSEYSEDWIKFIKKLGWDESKGMWQCVTLINIQID